MAPLSVDGPAIRMVLTRMISARYRGDAEAAVAATATGDGLFWFRLAQRIGSRGEGPPNGWLEGPRINSRRVPMGAARRVTVSSGDESAFPQAGGAYSTRGRSACQAREGADGKPAPTEAGLHAESRGAVDARMKRGYTRPTATTTDVYSQAARLGARRARGTASDGRVTRVARNQWRAAMLYVMTGGLPTPHGAIDRWRP